jgi:hypothetical protein
LWFHRPCQGLLSGIQLCVSVPIGSITQGAAQRIQFALNEAHFFGFLFPNLLSLCGFGDVASMRFNVSLARCSVSASE